MKILILGRATTKNNYLLEDADECYQVLTIGLYNRLKKLDYIDLYREHIWHPARDNYKYSILPKVDFIIYIGHMETWDEIDFEQLKRYTNYRKIISIFAECAILGADIAITFIPTNNSIYVKAPCFREFYKVFPKEPRTVLLDHWGGGKVEDVTYFLEDWLNDIKDNFKLFRQVQLGDIEDEVMLNKIPKYFTPIIQTGFPKYLELTDKIENYIVTHIESYGYSVIDMLARKTRVIAPKGFLKDWFTKEFNISVFKTKSELFEILFSPLSEEALIENMNRCNDFDEVISVIFKKLGVSNALSG